MTGPFQVNETPSEMPQPAAPRMYKYRVRSLNGEVWDFGSPWEWTVFWSLVKRDGYLVTTKGFMPYHSIATIVPLDDGTPIGGNVVHLVATNEPKHG